MIDKNPVELRLHVEKWSVRRELLSWWFLLVRMVVFAFEKKQQLCDIVKTLIKFFD